MGDYRLPLTEEEQWEKSIFPRDVEFENNISDLAEAGLWHRVNYFKKYAEERFVKLPEVMEKLRDDYWNENDPYAHYKEVELVEDEIGFIDGGELFLDYVRWFSVFYSQLPPPIWSTFKRSMEMSIGAMEVSGEDSQRGWPGYALRKQRAHHSADPEFGGH